jgi:hypothetical protein
MIEGFREISLMLQPPALSFAVESGAEGGGT